MENESLQQHTAHMPTRERKSTSQPAVKGRKRVFLTALAQHGIVTRAATAAGLSRAAIYQQRARYESFAEDWQNALDTAADTLEAEARRRGVEGWDEPVWHQGVQCGAVRKYSDRLLERLLAAKRPEFRNQPVVQVTQGGDLAAIFKNLASRLPD